MPIINLKLKKYSLNNYNIEATSQIVWSIFGLSYWPAPSYSISFFFFLQYFYFILFLNFKKLYYFFLFLFYVSRFFLCFRFLLWAVAVAAAKLLQSCPTLCDPIDGSPPGSPIPGILQARTLEWVAISFSSAWKWKVKGKSLSRVRLLAAPWTAASQAPPSMGFSRQEYWSGGCHRLFFHMQKG